MKKIGFLNIILVFLTILTVLSIFTMALAIVYPDATQRILQNFRTTLAPIINSEFIVRASNTMQKVREQAQEGYELRIRPFPQRVTNFIKEPFEKRQKELALQRKIAAFNECEKCHKNIFKKTVFNHIYIDHTIHQQRGVLCLKCHTDIKHPNPKAPKMDTCVNCHKQQRIAASCETCHAPGSIFEVIAKERTEHFQAGKSSRVLVKPAFMSPSFTGEKIETCKNCHNPPDFCNKCHLMFHKTLPDWVPTHGRNILGGVYKITICWQCHPATWCAETCHAQAPDRKRSGPHLPVPPLPLDVP
ncbi:MAG: hypothetical protein HY776_08470 [Actinobacteria bacterium]|nr:hypothetical protein [Actinomycetota bacterium]